MEIILKYSKCCQFRIYIGLATKWLRILSLDDIDKIRNQLVANPV